MKVNAYLQRIDYHGPLAPTAAVLRELQRAHLLTVPFENLSIHSSEPIVLDDEALFTKIVERRRGGFCYECNGLFAALLRALEFDVTMLSAEVANASGGFSQPFDHMALMVKLEQRWLVDVGFGDSFLEPLLLDERSEQIQGAHGYRITADGNYLILTRRDNEEWKPQYRFTLQPYQYEDFAGMCRYHQTSPQSHFTQGRICSRATDDGGRITLSAAKGPTPSDMRLINTTGNAERNERVLQSREEYADALRKHFGVVITG
ncbi:MAG TPA: arylamine N-acetyltransferase [Pyrinomonadaceae bacterium]|nr:arylamine N-acetyltransferase [Pyrinomonadaceae bacterium]